MNLTLAVAIACITTSLAAPGVVYMQKQPSLHQTIKDRPTPIDVQGTCEKLNTTKRLLTLNTALDSTTFNTKERREIIPVALDEDDSDVICLQGLWLEKDARHVMNLLMGSHPYSFSTFHERTESFSVPPCVGFAIVKLSICMLMNRCINAATNEDRLICGLTSCLSYINGLSQECRTCLMTNTVSTCLLTPRMNIPGLLLLSKTPMTNTTATPFIKDVPTLMPRYYLSADIEGVGHVVCTHLTANFPGPYAEVNLVDRFTSYEEQHAAEVQTLITSLASRADDVIMGDLNTSPSIPDSRIKGYFEDSYNDLVGASYTSLYVRNVTLCTYCHDNPIAGGSDYILDHILTKSNNQACAKRVYDQMVDSTPLSSHYGVKVDFQEQ